MSGFFSRKTLKQMLLYFMVGVYEWAAGWEIFKHIPVAQWIAYGSVSLGIGMTGFVIRKYAVFPEERARAKT